MSPRTSTRSCCARSPSRSSPSPRDGPWQPCAAAMPRATSSVTTTNTNRRCRSSRGLAGRRHPVPVVLGAVRPAPLRGADRPPLSWREALRPVLPREAGVGREPPREPAPPPRDVLPPRAVPPRDEVPPREGVLPRAGSAPRDGAGPRNPTCSAERVCPAHPACPADAAAHAPDRCPRAAPSACPPPRRAVPAAVRRRAPAPPARRSPSAAATAAACWDAPRGPWPDRPAPTARGRPGHRAAGPPRAPRGTASPRNCRARRASRPSTRTPGWRRARRRRWPG